MKKQRSSTKRIWVALMLAWGAGWGGSLQAVETVQKALVMLTPKPGPAPRINGPTVYGCRPGHPFLYRIPTQGERPIRFSAGGLPQ